MRAPELPTSHASTASQTRVAALEVELSAKEDAEARALLHLELGRLLRAGDEGGAVQHYLAAYREAGSLPALRALVDIFERRRSLTNLERLYTTLAGAEPGAGALVDLALLRRTAGQAGVEDALGEALERGPDAYAAAAAELLTRAAGGEALEGRLATADDAKLRALLLREQSAAPEETGGAGPVREAIRAGQLDEARSLLAAALAEAPDDLGLRLLRVGLEARADAPNVAADELRALLKEELGPLRAPLLARLASLTALTSFTTDDGSDALIDEAEGLAPGSLLIAARAARLRRGRRELEALVEASAPLDAAHMLAHELGDLTRADALYLEAASSAAGAEATAALRERYGAWVSLAEPAARVPALRTLLEQPLDDEERSALRYELVGLLAGPAADPAGALAVLEEALGEPQSALWAADLARVLGAQASRFDLVAAAHASLASSSEGATRAAHLAGAARAARLAGAEGDEAASLIARAAADEDAAARSSEAPDAALEALLSSSDPAALFAATASLAEGTDSDPLRLELAQAAWLAGDREAAQRALEERPEDDEPEEERPGEAYAQLRFGDESRAEALVTLAETVEAAGPAAELYLHALRAGLAAQAAGAAEDAYLWAQTVGEIAPDSLDAVIAQGESVGPGDDLEAYAKWGAGSLALSDEAPELRAAAARALTLGGREAEAFASLEAALALDPDDLASLNAMRRAARAVGHEARVVDACERLAAAAAGPMRARLLEEAGVVSMDSLGQDDRALKHFEAALEADPESELAYGRLHDLLAELGEERALLALVESRITREDAEEPLAKLYYEKARLLRSLGEREAALVALEELSMLDPSHVGGIALSVEIRVAQGDYAAAVSSLRAIALAEVPAQQKKVARLGAADFLEHRLGDPAGALDELRAVDALGLADAPLLRRMAKLATGGGLSADAASWLRRVLAAEPLDGESFDALAPLLGPEERVAAANTFEDAARARLTPATLDPETIRAIRQAALVSGSKDLAQAALGTLAAIGVATEAERKVIDENTAIIRRVRPSASLGEGALERLAAEGLRSNPFDQLASLACEALLEADALEPERFGVGRAELVAARPLSRLKEELSDITRAFGLELGDVYFGGAKPTRIVAMPGKKSSLHWVVGARVEAPLDTPVRFHAGRQAAGAAGRMLPLVNRTQGDAAALLYAAAAAAGSPLPGGDRPGVAEWTRAVDKVLSRRARKAIAEWATTLSDDGTRALAYCQAARTTALRAGLLASADLYGTLKLLLGAEPEWERVQASQDASELVCFWLSREAVSLRHDLGVTS